MKVSSIILSLGFAAFAAAQAANSTAPSVAVPTQTSSYTPEIASCLGKCKEDDVTCRAQCLGSAAPNDAAVSATNDCVGKCPQGNGTEADTEKYAKCVSSCINTIYLSTVAPSPTGGSGSGSGSGSESGSGSGGNSANPTATGKPTGTSSGSSSTSKPNAASSVKVTGSLLALFGIAAGVFAL